MATRVIVEDCPVCKGSGTELIRQPNGLIINTKCFNCKGTGVTDEED